jgi:hypothetical protein
MDKKDLLERLRVASTTGKLLGSPLRRLTIANRTQRDEPIRRKVEGKNGQSAKHLRTGPRPAWHRPLVPIRRPGQSDAIKVNNVRRITQGDFIAEITVNRETKPQLFHYVITRKGHAEILEWGQAVSVYAAESRARIALRRHAATMPEGEVAAD